MKYTMTVHGFGQGMYDEATGQHRVTLSELLLLLPSRVYAGDVQVVLAVDRIGSCLYLEFDAPDDGPDRIGQFERAEPR